jgi:hypothetical protein
LYHFGMDRVENIYQQYFHYCVRECYGDYRHCLRSNC